MSPKLQPRSFFWRFLRNYHKTVNTPLSKVFRHLFPFVPDSIFSNNTHFRNVYTTVDALRFIVSPYPSRLSYPIPFFAAGLAAALTAFVNLWVTFNIANDVISNNELFSMHSQCQLTVFDYIVVGGGTAGMIVATKIANASKNMRVLLLEAGGDPSILNDIPSFDAYMMSQPANTWRYRSIPQEHAGHSCDGKRTLTTTGKMLGGSSSINFMLYVRGNKEDFNRWAQDAQDEEWNYENVLPYFKKSENYNGVFAKHNSSSKFHGKGGLLNIATFKYMPGSEDFLAAGKEKGYSIGDYNGEEQEVFSNMDVTTENGWRESVYRAFYQDTGQPHNLCIKKYAHVEKINFEQNEIDGRIRATGVTYHRHGHVRSASASKEVIVCAGTFKSAKLLLLSGIGPSEELRNLGIPIIRDLPVGKYFQDHVFALVGPFLKGPSINPNRDIITAKALSEMLLNEDGVPSAPAGFSGNAFFASPVAEPAYPDLQAMQYSISVHPEMPQMLDNTLGLKMSILKEWLHPYDTQNLDARLIILILGRPKSVGQVSLGGTDPNDDLIIDPKYLSHPDDREAMLYGFKTIVDLFENSTALDTPLFPKPVPGCEHEIFKSDEYFNCVIRHMSGSYNHPVGTCALGKVVDSRLRVKGIDGLRVIDASVMPRTPNGNTQAATIMIGEKGADFIISEMLQHSDSASRHNKRGL